MKKAMIDQRAAQRWSNGGEDFSQVSCFFADGEAITFNEIMGFRGYIESSIKEASLTAPSNNARAYIDAYSSIGTVNIRSERSALETAAIGIGGDFFLFHPLELVNGAYFSGHDLMQDAVILDEEAAWHLFGSSDIIGMPVSIGGVNHYVRGVIKRETGRMWEGAGLSGGVAYISNDSLSLYGQTMGIRSYEVVMPNPVSGFAYRVVTEKFGFSEERMKVVDNTARFNLQPLALVILDVGLRSMQSYAIRFPYWENYARGYEDILAFLLVFQVLFLVTPVTMMLVIVFVVSKREIRKWVALRRKRKHDYKYEGYEKF